jgi:tetratricopeptide (TPR) repeat protein
MKLKTLSLIATLAPLIGATAVPIGYAGEAEASESPSEQLERGIYKEETVGDIEAAIEIYRQVIDAVDASRHAQAEAQLRLGLCYLKLGRRAEAREVLQRLVDVFPDQGAFVERGRQHLATCGMTSDLEIGPAPWKDGEALVLEGKLPGGRTIGMLAFYARQEIIDNEALSHFQIRRFIATNSKNRGVSEVFTTPDTLQPKRGLFYHGMLGNVDSTYGKDSVHVLHRGTEENIDRTFEFEGPVFDNASVVHLTRRLPLAEGYEVTLPVMVTFVGGLTPIDVTVKGIESVTVPAGTFECFKVSFSIGETHWYSTDAHRYPVKLDTGGVSFQLSQISQRVAGSLGTYSDDEFGASLTLPDGWLAEGFERTSDHLAVIMLDPRMQAPSVVELGLTDPADAETVQTRAERELAGVKRKVKGYTLMSKTDMTIDGHKAIRFVGSYEKEDVPMIQDRAYVVLPDRWIEFIFKVPTEHYEELRSDLTRIIESYRSPS